jgi:uncharacterized protein YkwD
MPGDHRRSIIQRIFPTTHAALWRIGAVASVLALSCAGAAFVHGAPGTSATGHDRAVPTATATLVRRIPSEAETMRDLWQYADVEFRSQATATPTMTPIPPTPVPPTAVPTVRPPAAPRQGGAAPSGSRSQPPTATAVPPTPIPPAPPASSGLDTSPMDGYEQALFDATNARRVASGLAPLRVNGHLIGIARLRSDEMARYNYFSHESPITGHTAFSLMDQYGVPYGWAGENLAKNNYPNDQTVAVADEALWNSPSHRANILNTHYTDMGIALTIDATGMKYFTIIFTGP